MPPKVLAGVVLVIGLLSAIPVLKAADTPAEMRTGEVGNLDAMMKARQPAWVALANPFLSLSVFAALAVYWLLPGTGPRPMTATDE